VIVGTLVLGHNLIMTTARYAHLEKGIEAKAMEPSSDRTQNWRITGLRHAPIFSIEPSEYWGFGFGPTPTIQYSVLPSMRITAQTRQTHVAAQSIEAVAFKDKNDR